MKITRDVAIGLMREAISEAHKAEIAGEVPIGAVIAVVDNKGSPSIIGRGFNLVESRKSATAHAELVAIAEASASLGNWRLNNAVLCVTAEPCTMCVGAILLSRISTVIFGTTEPRTGALGSIYDLSLDSSGERVFRVIQGICSDEASHILQRFFAFQRKRT